MLKKSFLEKVYIMMTDAAWHALVIVSFLLVGVPSNVAVLWIHTRKNSRVAKNKFPLIFAAIDLFALVTNLPLQQFAFKTRGESATDNTFFNISSMFCLNGYLMTLFMATIDKFYAVMFPFKYGKRRARIFKTTITITTVPNAMQAVATVSSVYILGPQVFIYVVAFYNVFLSLMFLTINILYIFIIAKIMRNRRNLRKVNDSG